MLINASNQALYSDRDGQVKIQAEGGVHIEFSPTFSISIDDMSGGWASISDERLKTDIVPVQYLSFLDKFKQLPIHYWVYKAQPLVQHIGPTAQDFKRIFDYGDSSTSIHSVDSDGVLLAAIKGVSQKLMKWMNITTII